jgi:hypothetical protein
MNFGFEASAHIITTKKSGFCDLEPRNVTDLLCNIRNKHSVLFVMYPNNKTERPNDPIRIPEASMIEKPVSARCLDQG